MKSIIYNLIKIIFLLILPFITLIRGAVFIHEQYNPWPFFSLFGGIMASALVIFFYLIFIQAKITGEFGSIKRLKRSYWAATVLILVYCIPGLLFLSAANAKHEAIQKEFTSLHPVLRLGISTLVFVDQKVLLTDASRMPEDYHKMGLKVNSHSLHYKQSSGYAHAVDIRTKGRSEFRNNLIIWYFKVMGFNTLRHVGTADHLHVSIMSHDRPGGI